MECVESSVSVVECLTQDRGAVDSNLTQALHYVLKQDTLALLSTGIMQEDPSRHNWKNVDWDLQNQIKQKTMDCYTICIFNDIDSWLYLESSALL